MTVSDTDRERAENALDERLERLAAALRPFRIDLTMERVDRRVDVVATLRDARAPRTHRPYRCATALLRPSNLERAARESLEDLLRDLESDVLGTFEDAVEQLRAAPAEVSE